MSSPQQHKNVDSLSDLRSAIMMMKTLGLNISGVTNLEEAKEKIRIHIENSKRPESSNIDFNILKEDLKKRNVLLKKYIQTRAYLEKLPHNIKADLNELFPNFTATLESHISDLRQRDCLIMLAGETGSGKSSLINLIIGEKVLPVSPLCCTASFCELRGSKDGSKYANVRFKDTSRTPLRIDLSSNEGLKQLVEYIQLPNDPDIDCESSVVQVFWPSDILQEGVVLVDTPGIGENKEMISYLASYMSKAFGFIYVVNAASAGGVQKDRLSRLLRIVNEGNTEFEYLTQSTIFVSNKWESIPTNEKAEVREDTLEKLRKFYPKLRDEQLICLSVTSLMNLDNQTAPAEFLQFFTALSTLIPATMKNKIFLNYKWLSTLLKRSVYSLKVKTHAGKRNLVDKSELYSTLRRQISMLERQTTACVKEMRIEAQNELLTIYEDLIVYLKSGAVKEDINTWSSAINLSVKVGHWRELGQQAIDCVGSKVMLVINEWELKNNLIGNLSKHMLEKFRHRFDKLEMQIFQVESELAGNKEAFSLQQSIKKPQQSVKLASIFPREDDPYSQNFANIIGYAISSLGNVSIERKEIKKRLKSMFTSTKPKSKDLLQDIAKYYILSITEHENLQKTLNKLFSKIFRDIDTLGNKLPEFLKADQALLDNIEREFYKKEYNLSEKMPDFITECNKLQGDLDMFYVKELFVPDIDLNQIELSPSDAPLGTGSFATVFLCYLKTKDGLKKVAMKAWSEKLSSSNVSDTLLEDSILRNIKHKNVIYYYGSNFRRIQDGSLQWLMILEYCVTTLKNIFIRDDDKYKVNPAKYQSKTKQKVVMQTFTIFVLQLCEAISYLHQKNLVHRDLKMENILVTEDNTIKLTDVGLSKLERDIAGSIAGSPCYMAPEIFERKFIYGKKADIYSFSIVLWEMWYGMDVVTYIRPLIHKSIEDTVIGGLRPTLNMTEKPPEDFQQLIKRCWGKDPDKRPDIEECITFFKQWS